VTLGSDPVRLLVLLFQSANHLKAIHLELLLNLIASKPSFPTSIFLRAEDDTATGSTEAFLSSKLHYTRDKQGQEICLLREGDKEVGVMMGWERDISEYRTLHPS
jgi:protein arginine N-methyltransferase 2